MEESLNWIYLVQDWERYESGNEISGSVKCGEFLD